jgi:hypothetical protein
MGIPLHDHTKRTVDVWCPLMREVCRDGWTKSMGNGGLFGNKEKPKCVKWRGVFVNNPMSVPKMQEVFDCVDAWIPDLLQQVAEETYQGAAASEQTRNHVAGQAGVFKQMGMAFRAMARKNGVTPADVMELEREDAEARKLLEGGKTVPPKTSEGGGDGNP